MTQQYSFILRVTDTPLKATTYTYLTIWQEKRMLWKVSRCSIIKIEHLLTEGEVCGTTYPLHIMLSNVLPGTTQTLHTCAQWNIVVYSRPQVTLIVLNNSQKQPVTMTVIGPFMLYTQNAFRPFCNLVRTDELIHTEQELSNQKVWGCCCSRWPGRNKEEQECKQ